MQTDPDPLEGRAFAALDRLAGGLDRLGIALSGGGDSVALMHLAAGWAADRGIRLAAATVDHGLRDGSAAEAAAAGHAAAALGLDHAVLRWDGAGSGNLMDRARRARLRLLAGWSQDHGLAAVALGHTRDDQAETVLLGLARGSGPRSLAGMPARRGRLVRPLLGLPRRLTSQACAELGLSPWQDPMNEDPHYARVRVRGRVLPLLERELGPGIAEALARTADLCRDAADALDAAAAPLAGEPEPDAEALAAAPAGVRRAALAAWLLGRGAPEATTAHVAAVEALVLRWHGQRGVDVPGGTVVREDGHLAYVPR